MPFHVLSARLIFFTLSTMFAAVMYWYCLFHLSASDCLIIDMIVHMVALGPVLLLREIQIPSYLSIL